MHTPVMRYDIHTTPVGQVLAAANDDGLALILFEAGGHFRAPSPDWRRDRAALAPLKAQLDEYFRGERRSFDLPLAPVGTSFQREVWQALLEIPYGETRSYGDIAASVGRPGSARAVGAANGRNPLSIVVPCHRVIGANRSLTGYAGGIETKRRLLNLEGGAWS